MEERRGEQRWVEGRRGPSSGQNALLHCPSSRGVIWPPLSTVRGITLARAWALVSCARDGQGATAKIISVDRERSLHLVGTSVE